jgi:hypothetical protein
MYIFTHILLFMYLSYDVVHDNININKDNALVIATELIGMGIYIYIYIYIYIHLVITIESTVGMGNVLDIHCWSVLICLFLLLFVC